MEPVFFEMSDKSQKMLEELLGVHRKRITEYVSYLERLYINGTLIMLDITDEIESEHMQFATNLGLCKEMGEDIFNQFLDAHGIDEKNDVLFALLLAYGRMGHFHLEKIQKANAHMTDFWNHEFVRLEKAVEDIFQLQNLMHQESALADLSVDQYAELYKKAEEMGFYDKSSIRQIINGNEIRLGYRKA